MGYERDRSGWRDPRGYMADDHDSYAAARDYGVGRDLDRGRGGYDRTDRGYAGQDHARGSYGQGGYDRRPTGYYGNEDWTDRGGSQGRPDHRERSDHRGPSRGHDPRDRGFLDRAGDEVRSWFGDREAEHRREQDVRLDQQRDADYHSWRSGQIAALDRDYDEYRRENRSKFENEFVSWRTERQGQRNALGQVREHMDVVGADGSHVGTVDKVRGDRIVLTKNDQDAGGRHHSVPSRWIQAVDDKVTLRKTAEEAKREWRDEEREQSFFGEGRGDRSIGDDRGAHMLGRSFSGTYDR